MDIIEKTYQIIAKYNLKADSYLNYNPFVVAREIGDRLGMSEPYLAASTEAITKFITPDKELRIADRWYGFDLYGASPIWLDALEEFLIELEKDSPDYQFLQWKMKFGGLRLYTANITEDAQKALDLLTDVCYDSNLIY
jgi:hypothetical protein